MNKNHKLYSVQLELTSRCNERCVHCYIPHEWKTRDMDSALLMSLLDQCRDMGVEQVIFSGGEPMLHKHFLDFLRKAKEYDFSINTLSNLTLLNDEIIAEMKANRLSLDEVAKVINDIIANDDTYQKEMLNADFAAADSRDIANDIVCEVCVSSICMVANGNVYPCAGWQDYVCGNLRETSLRGIWENSPKVKYLRSLRKKDFPNA